MKNSIIASRNTNVLKFFALLSTLSLLVMLAACSGSNKTTPPPAVTVTLSTFPASLYVSDTAPITATVANDSSNAGVTWSCSPSGSCGTFSSSTSASGTPVTYTAPTTVPSSTVVITATSAASTSVSASTSAVTINPASGITVSLSGAPASLSAGGTASVTATLANDSANGGVTWSCAPAGSCGSFSSNTSASGTAVTYTAPSTAGSVTITATSVTDDAQSASAGITITTSVATTLPAGNYVFSLAGSDLNSVNGFSIYFYTGAFTVNSTGAITSGEQDFSDSNYVVLAEQITGGTITPSADGNLQITLTLPTTETYIANNAGQVTFDASPVSNSKALLIEYDDWASSSGELDAQAATLATPSGGYAFYESGVDFGGAPASLGGVINVDDLSGTTGTISGTGSVFDLNDAGSLTPDQSLTANASTVSSPDGFGRVYFQLNTSCTLWPCTGAASIILDGYMVDANHIRVLENYYNDDASVLMGGTLLGQPTAGGFSTNSISGSTYVIATNGYDTTGALQVAGALTFNADGSVTGNISFNDIGSQAPQGGTALAAESSTTPCSSGSATTACYVVDAAGTGRVTVTNVTDGATFNYNFQLYLTGDGHALVISMDNSDVLSGPGWAQASSTTFTAGSLTGGYALGMTEVANTNEQDAVGAFNSDGVSSISGFLDYNGSVSVSPGTLVLDQAFGSSYATTSTNGVFMVTGNGNSGSLYTSYLIDGTKGIVIENDSSQLSLGYFEQQ